MDQSELRQWEHHCIQDEPPECTAACPIHVDVRAFIGHLQKDRWDEGWNTLVRTMPLAGLLGRICDAPCQAQCKRREAGDAVQIGALERACVKLAAGAYRMTPLPSKDKKVALLGSGLSSLTAAWDLIRKGYGVTVFEPDAAPGATLVDAYPELTGDIVSAEIAWLEKSGVCFETQASLSSRHFFDRCMEGFDGLYIGLDAVTSTRWDIARGKNGAVRVDAGTHTTSRSAVFAGGDDGSTIMRVAQGRWAATSMDRFLQNVSMTAGRDREGVRKTRLFTSLSGIDRQPAVPMADPVQGYCTAEAVAEASRCLSCQCLECVKVCHYLAHFGAYPRKYAREIYNNASMVMGSRKANTLINSCSLCGLCETVCPEDFTMQDLCLQARQDMVRRGKMPPSAHEFAMQDMAFSQGDDFFLARHAPGAVQSRYLFFPGCQLCASSPGHVAALYSHLNDVMDGGVGLMLGCCGAPAFWAGRETDFAQAQTQWHHHWDALGKPRLIVACATCHRMFRDGQRQVPVQSLWQVLEHAALPAGGNPTAIPMSLAVHDPCTTRDMPQTQEAVRRLLMKLGVSIAELPLGREHTECCGFGGLMQNANPPVANEVARRRAALSAHDYLTYCAMCRDSLAAAGKRVIHLLDLIFPDIAGPDPASRPRPGWSRRRENRIRLKADLLSQVWRERPREGPDHRNLVLEMTDEVRQQLDQRRILIEDVQQTIAMAEAGGSQFRHPGTGRIKAAGRLGHVTFWVEYAPKKGKGTVFKIFNAYAHRMVVNS